MGFFRFTTGLGIGVLCGAHIAQTYNLPRVQSYVTRAIKTGLHVEQAMRKDGTSE